MKKLRNVAVLFLFVPALGGCIAGIPATAAWLVGGSIGLAVTSKAINDHVINPDKTADAKAGVGDKVVAKK